MSARVARPIRAHRRRRVPAAVLAAGLVCVLSTVAGCGGVPARSSPQVIKRVQVAQPNNVSVTPEPGAGPREIVNEFLQAVETSDTNHTAARGFLTADASARWSDSTTTVLQGPIVVGNFDNGTVQVSGQPVGTLSATGVYTPVLQGDGSGGPSLGFSFGLEQVKGQWRVSALQKGIILSQASFEQLYRQRELFFYNQDPNPAYDEKFLIPDPRFTPLTDPSLLASWLVTELVGGPSAPSPLQNAVASAFPAQTEAARVSIVGGTPARITVPGAGSLDGTTLDLLAGQLANTLAQVSGMSTMQIVDAGRAVRVPQTGSTVFSALDFAPAVAAPVTTPSLYYIYRGGVVDALGHPLAGAVGSGDYGLSSAALGLAGPGDLRVAGVSGQGAGGRLYVGTLHGGLKATAVHGQMSRPAWVPGRDEVWVGAGSALQRCTLPGACTTAPLLAGSGSVSKGTIASLRFSPEGGRVAMVIAGADGSAQVWVGAVDRTGTQVRVDGLTAITPVGIVIRDVAWNDPLRLFVIGSSSTNIYEVQVDGSLWTPRTIPGLPQNPDSITVAENQEAWVSAGQTVWVQRAGSWTYPGNGQTPGVNPVYAE
jgi:lipoprotein LpqB-like beta-propeller protein/sporulation and spore germination protein